MKVECFIDEASQNETMKKGGEYLVKPVSLAAEGADGMMWLNNTGISLGFLPGRQTIGPLLLMLASPIFSICIWWICHFHHGNIGSALGSFTGEGYIHEIQNGGAMVSGQSLMDVFPSFLSLKAWNIIGLFMAMSLALTRLLPHTIFKGPPSPTGYRNRYYNNGPKFWITMVALFMSGSQFGLGFYNAGILYDNYGEILSSLNLFAFVFCSFLYAKGILWPSSKDAGTTGNFIFDYYFGTELYPNLGGWDVKQFTNSRFGLAWWGIASISCAAKQYEKYGYVSESMMLGVVLQMIYITKFFFWETGYFCSLDIQHDRAGFYICWGCLVWVPSVYVSPSLWSVNNPTPISWPIAFVLLAFGIVMIWINYDADCQRQSFRQSGGNVKIWGQKPLVIRTSYRDELGHTRHSILLASGWWGVARHFHYIPEILAALTWSPPVQSTHVIPYFYTMFLTCLLVDRAFRDDARCHSKYGKHWEDYRQLVPYKLIPFVF